MAQPSYATPPTEDWRDFVAWDGDMCDPMFDGDNGFTGLQGHTLAPDYRLSESLESEQPYLVSAPPSLAGGLPSLEYTVSEPPSILGESSSYGQMYCTSPSFGNTTTSPLIGYGDSRYFGSFDASDSAHSPLSYPQESPILDTRYERIPDNVPTTGSYESPTETVFNPYVTGSSHSFSGLDVRASQMLNVGTWVDQPQIIEPIAEADEYNTDAIPISIPYPQSQSFNEAFTSYPRSEERTRAVAIPQTSRRPASYNTALAQSQWTHRVPPVLSVSPVSYRRPRSATLSRSNSRTSSRRGVVTPSPTSEGLGWVAYQMNTSTNRLAPTTMEGAQGRNPRGRKKGLTTEQRTHAALMRIIGACANCQKRKEKCDPGTPCRSCLDHYKGDLVNHPCRDRVLSDQASAFLSEGLGWHPTARTLESFLAPGSYQILSNVTHTIPLYFGFGPELSVPVHPLHIEVGQQYLHEHSIYTWPPTVSTSMTHKHAVLPAAMTRDAMSHLTQTLDTHLSLLVMHHFREFPLFCSPLKILRDVYLYFRSLPNGSTKSRTLRQALKLLVLVHIGGDISVPSPNTHPILHQFAQGTADIADDYTLTPCYIRSQFGSVMPELAFNMMKEVLSSLEQLLLNRDCEDWPMTLAVITTILMTIESIHYHAAKLPYHSSLDGPRPLTLDEGAGINEEGVKTLLAFYTACFAGCHARLRPDWEGESITSQSASSPDDVFVQSVRKSIGRASVDGYLSRKATQARQGDDMEFFFDRLVARLLLSKP
ncbi:hypothetical protein HBH61_037760 [Parastagonospora nodorum]|nr:hypothetical protein HBH61_037760 [Parastagonospora nodorum]KAH5033771.1 hypothetical protein HBI74_071560 [Parastagonospora nodorum]